MHSFCPQDRPEDLGPLDYTLGTALSSASPQYVLVSSLSWKIVMEAQVQLSSEGLKKPRINPVTPCLQGYGFTSKTNTFRRFAKIYTQL